MTTEANSSACPSSQNGLFPAQLAWVHQGILGSDLIHHNILGLRKYSKIWYTWKRLPKKWNVRQNHQKKDNIKEKEKQENMERCAIKKNYKRKKKSQEGKSISSLVIYRVCAWLRHKQLCTASSVQYKCIWQEIHKSEEQSLSRWELEGPGSFAILSTKEVSIVFPCSEETKAFLANQHVDISLELITYSAKRLYSSFTLRNETIEGPGACVSDVSIGFCGSQPATDSLFWFYWDKLQKWNSQNFMKSYVRFCILLVLLYLHEVRKEDGRRKLLIWYKNFVHAPMVISVIPSWNKWKNLTRL